MNDTNTGLTEEFARDLQAQVETEGALMSFGDMDAMERYWERDRRQRRAALLFTTKPWAELDKSIQEDREFALAVANVFDCLNIEAYKSIYAILNEARRRILVSLCSREDAQELLKEARLEINESNP